MRFARLAKAQHEEKSGRLAKKHDDGDPQILGRPFFAIPPGAPGFYLTRPALIPNETAQLTAQATARGGPKTLTTQNGLRNLRNERAMTGTSLRSALRNMVASMSLLSRHR
jgi:hypothetical protein